MTGTDVTELAVQDCAPVAWLEEDRLAALERYAILDSGREEGFDDIAELAADLFDAPIAVVNLIASDRQWFKAEVGIGTDTLPLDVSICRHAILQSDILVVPDLRLDRRFDGNALVHSADGLRFYTGALLETPEGLPLGTVCVLDTKARPDGITSRQARALKVLAGQTMARLELRRTEGIAQTQRARAEKHARRLTLVAQASTLLLGAKDPDAAIPDLFALVADEFRLDVGFHYQCGGGALRLVAAAGLTAEQELAAARIEFGKTVCGIVAARREAMHVTEIQTSEQEHASFLKPLGVDTYLSVPLIAGGDLLGTVSFGRKQSAFTPGELEALNTIGTQVATALERRFAEAEVRASEAQVARVLDGMGEGFVLLDREFRILRINAEGLRVDGRAAAEVISRTHWDVWPESEDAPQGQLYKRLMRDRVAGELNIHYEWPDRQGWFETRVYPVEEGLAVFFRDVGERVRAETDLRESEARYRTLFEAIDAGFCIIELITDDTGHAVDYRFIEANPAIERQSGLKDIVGRRIREFAPNFEEHWFERYVHVARTGEAVRFEDHAADLGRWFDVNAFRVGEPERRRVAILFNDISARKNAEEDLRTLNVELERKVTERALARSRTWTVSPDIMGVINAAGVFEQSNPAWLSVLGWTEEEVSLAVFFDFIHPDDLERTQRAWTDATERSEPALRFENRYRHKNGGWCWLSWVAVPDDGKVYCSARDVTAEKAQAEVLAERTAERDRMWETSPDLLLVIDFDGVFRRVNPAWTDLLGYAPDELVGRHVNTFVVPDDHDSTTDAYEHAAVGGRPVIENRYRHKDGSIRWISWVAAPAGDMTYATGRDITRDKERQAELVQAQEALRQSQKMEAMGQLTGGVAHDFNNLLTPIVGSLDMLQRRGIGGEREQRLIAGAAQSAERARVLVQRLLAFARRQPLQPTTVDIGNLVSGMADLVASTTGPQIKVVVDVAAGLPPATADANQLEMAILNLSVNARDAMPEGGTLRISATSAQVRPGQVEELSAGAYVKVSVADTGVGMDDKTLARAIEPFFSTKGVGKGTGLGLSMVHGLASQLGGALLVSSRLGLGTNVELWLPESLASVDAVETRKETGAIGGGQGTVLLVDDEDIVRMSTADMLSDLGYEVIEAASAEAALELFDGGLRPDLLITDHLMPGMTGIELARASKTRMPKLPVLVVSGYAESEGVAPEVARLTKPFRIEDLSASLAALSPTSATTNLCF